MQGTRAVWAVAGVYAMWLLAWVMATPAFSGADEWAHYLRGLGIREGRLIGDRLPEGLRALFKRWLRFFFSGIGAGTSPLSD
jgi:hypothetical protein